MATTGPKNPVRDAAPEAGIRGGWGSKAELGDELLRVHRDYQPLLAKAPVGVIKGLAHITGGGLIDNLPRVLPKSCDAVITTSSPWKKPSHLPTDGEGRQRAAPRKCIRSLTWE